MYPYPLPKIDMQQKIIIFGAGEVGKQYYQQIDQLDKADTIICFIDSNAERKRIYGKKVCKIEDLDFGNLENVQYLIATINYADEVKNILIQAGISAKYIKEPPSPRTKNMYISDKELNSVAFYPIIEQREVLENLLRKMNWYIPEVPQGKSVTLYVDSNILDGNIYEKAAKLNVSLQSNYDDLSKTKDCILIWDQNVLLTHSVQEYYEKAYVVDETYYSIVASINWSRIYSALTRSENKTYYEDQSKENFAKLLKKYSNYSKAAVFGTGPSVQYSYNYSFENSCNIICNSIVKDKQLLAHIKPDIMTFADPVFHNGYSEYSCKFREHLLNMLNEYDCFCIVPDYILPLYLYHYPELKNVIIGIPSFSSNSYNFPTTDEFWVKNSENISTIFMLPIASSIAKEIYLIGFDGRVKDENYFWKHDPSTQYTDLMSTVYDSHPSFFRDRVYDDYYEEHCLRLRTLMEQGEKDGKEYVSLVNSHIPCLKERKKSFEEHF